MRKRGKRGFSLIEMLVVIAIIAVLVAIITPAVNSYTTKANAAANAANLRSVKAQLSTMLLQGQITYTTSQAPDQLNTQIDLFKSQIDKSNLNDILKNLINSLLDDIKKGVSSVGNYAQTLFNTYYASDGLLNIDGVTITAPPAKAVSLGDFKLRKDTEMTVIISDSEIYVTYGGLTPEFMSIVAADGDHTTIDWSVTSHSFIDSNVDLTCDICNGNYQHSTEDTIKDSIGNVIGGGHVCSSNDTDCICDDPNCGLTVICIDANLDGHCDRCVSLQVLGRHHDYTNDGICDIERCNVSVTHEHKDINGDCVCDGTNCEYADHNYNLAGVGVVCNNCGYIKNHSYLGVMGSNCFTCGSPKSHSSHK